jgi:hypothetical protein
MTFTWVLGLSRLLRPTPPVLPSFTSPTQVLRQKELGVFLDPALASLGASTQIDSLARFFHGAIDRVEAERRLESTGQPGAFLLREKVPGQVYVMSFLDKQMGKQVRLSASPINVRLCYVISIFAFRLDFVACSTLAPHCCNTRPNNRTPSAHHLHTHHHYHTVFTPPPPTHTHTHAASAHRTRGCRG